jgi:hypothetical protein
VAHREPVIVAANTVVGRIVVVRGQKVMLDSDLAELYHVATKNLNTAVRRNKERFPVDFMFRLTEREFGGLRLQFAASKGRGGRRYLPQVFTEQGVAMLSSVLRSRRAALVNIEIMRAFAKLRRILSTHTELAAKLAVLESKYDRQFKIVFDAIRELMEAPQPTRRPIGFTTDR